MSKSQTQRRPRTSKQESERTRFLGPSPPERNWIRKMPDLYPDILRAPAVSYKAERDDTRIQTNQYLTFARPYQYRQGLLLVGHDTRPLIIDETAPEKCHVIPMRLDRESIRGAWIFAVSIYEAEGLIQLEDCVVADGEAIRSTRAYKDRYRQLKRFTDAIWFPDQRFQLNWQIRLADIQSLSDIRKAVAEIHSGHLCLMPDLATYRLLRVVPKKAEASTVPVGGPQEFICWPVLDKPDVYDLKDSKGADVGRASVQSLSMSQAMAQRRATEKSWRVMAEWDADFEGYVVLSII